MRARWGVAIALAACALVPLSTARARADERDGAVEARIAALPPGVAAGAIVTIEWGGVPGDAEELELLLSLDDGRRFPIRVSPELSGAARRFTWRVPNLPSANARLRLRWNDGRGERESGPSAAFRIVAAPNRPPDRAQMSEALWWCGLDAAEGDAGTAFAPGGGARLLATREKLPIAAAAGTPLLDAARDAARDSRPGPPLRIPLRN
jgi:hypothetical protein